MSSDDGYTEEGESLEDWSEEEEQSEDCSSPEIIEGVEAFLECLYVMRGTYGVTEEHRLRESLREGLERYAEDTDMENSESTESETAKQIDTHEVYLSDYAWWFSMPWIAHDEWDIPYD